MARRVKDATLDSKDARRKLKVSGKPHWRSIERGLHLGYRRLKSGAGTWCIRHYVGEQTYQVESIGIADDISDADGEQILTFWQAQDKARARRGERVETTAGKGRPWTVADAMDGYFDYLESEGRTEAAIDDAKYRDRAFIRPKLGDHQLSALTADRLRQWRDGLVKLAPRLRTRDGQKQRHREITGEDAKRARRASVNRTWTTLRAALNRAFETDKVKSDTAWRKVKPFKSVDKARVRYLEMSEAKRLINACDPGFRPMVQAALLTGGRYSQIAALTPADFNADAGTLRLSTRKGDGSVRAHHAHLSDEAVQFFKHAVMGKGGRDLLFTKENGEVWGKSHQNRPIEEASERAKISPAANFHVTRHTWASHAVMNGVPLLVVAKNLGHADTRMVEKHYGHLAPSFIASAIREGAPKFGFKPDKKVAALRT